MELLLIALIASVAVNVVQIFFVRSARKEARVWKLGTKSWMKASKSWERSAKQVATELGMAHRDLRELRRRHV